MESGHFIFKTVTYRAYFRLATAGCLLIAYCGKSKTVTCLVSLRHARFSRCLTEVSSVTLECNAFLTIIWTFLSPRASNTAKKNCDGPFKNLSQVRFVQHIASCETKLKLQWNGRRRSSYAASRLKQKLNVSEFCLRKVLLVNLN